MNLNDTQLVLLSAAAQRDDHLLIRPENLTGKAVEKLAARLLRLRAVQEVSVMIDEPFWHERDHERIGLQITAAGLNAIGLGDGEALASVPPAQLAPVVRSGTKKAQVIDLLRREVGASLDDLIGATGWLPHTTRAALTGLRKAGHELTKSKDAQGRTVYRLGMPQSAAE